MKDILNTYKEIFQDKTIIGSIFIGIPEAILFTIFAPILLVVILPMYPIMKVFNSDTYCKFEEKVKALFYKPY